MSEITRYVLVDKQDREGDYEYARFDEAKQAAGDDHAVIERTYTYDDQELVWTPDGGNVWPPEEKTEEEDQ